MLKMDMLICWSLTLKIPVQNLTLLGLCCHYLFLTGFADGISPGSYFSLTISLNDPTRICLSNLWIALSCLPFRLKLSTLCNPDQACNTDRTLFYPVLLDLTHAPVSRAAVHWPPHSSVQAHSPSFIQVKELLFSRGLPTEIMKSRLRDFKKELVPLEWSVRFPFLQPSSIL